MSGDIGTSDISFSNIVTAYNNIYTPDLPTTNISLSIFRDKSFANGSSIPSTGAISIFSNFRGKTWGSSVSETKLLASDGASGDLFGSSVSISSDGLTAIVGAWGDDDNGSSSGSAYIFKYANGEWTETKLTADDGASDDNFGRFLSITGDGLTAIVGAFQDDSNKGSAYIFEYANGSWTQTKLLASDGASGDYFGSSVSISSDGLTAIVGAYFDDSRKGSAYIFKYANGSWTETKLLASDGAIYDYFGSSVSISSDGLTAIVGAYSDVENGSRSGSAYIFKYANGVWSQTEELLASDGATYDNFGYSVSISSDGLTAIVGAYGDDDNGSSSGSAYIFEYANGSWTQTKLLASDGASSDNFGRSVSISGDGLTAIVGAYGDDDNGSSSGSAYIFKYANGSWTETTKLLASDGASGDNFGNSVSISSDGLTIIVGAYSDVENGSRSGSAYIYNYL